jgi:hypothetical protein
MSGDWFVTGGWLFACATTSTWLTSSFMRHGLYRLGVLWVSCVAYLTNGIVLIDRSPFSFCVAFVTHDEPRSGLYVPPC